MNFTVLLLVLMLAGFSAGAQPLLPDPNLTPGNVRTNTVEGLLAVKSTKTIRSVPERERQAVFQRYGIPYDQAKNYEVDHLLSLELGGLNSISNLWPQSYITLPYNAHVKDKLENFMARQVKAIAKTNHTQATATLRLYQSEICTNWIAAYQKYLRKP